MTDAGAAPPRISVLVACWNAAATIERALASALDADGLDVECVVVDDGSTDGTAEVVATKAAADPRIRLLALPENAGVSEARNRGLEVVRGTWLAFLDADDRLLPGALHALLGPTADPTIRAVIGQRIWTDGERTWLSSTYDVPDIRQPGRKSIVRHPGLLSYASTTGKLFHRSLTEGLTFRGRVLGDQPWTIRALLRAGDDLEVIGDTVYEWRRPHPDRYVATITAAKARSSDRATEMVEVALGAFAEVADEVDARVADPTDRHRVKVAYLDRLIRSDFSGPVRATIERRDPDTGRLYRAIGTFLASVSPEVLADSAYVTSNVLRPPLSRWHRLPGEGRAAYWTMLRPVLAADPRELYRVLGLAGAMTRSGGRLATAVLGTRIGRSMASGLVWVAAAGRSAVRALVGRLGRGRAAQA